MSSEIKFKPQGFDYWLNRAKDDEKKDWNKDAQNWVVDYWNSYLHPHRKLILRHMPEDVTSILELGCNAGPNIKTIREKFPEIRLAGIDANPDAIMLAQSLFPAAVEFRHGDIAQLPYPDKSFDMILSDAVLMYVGPEMIEQVLQEIDRVARKNIMLIEWDSKSEAGEVKNFHWARNYRTIIKRRGFSVRRYKIGPVDWPTKTWYNNGYIYIFTRK